MKQSKLSSNYFYSMLYRISICVLPLIVTPYLTRTLSPESNGLYVYTSTIACFFIMFCKLGLESYGNRFIASIRDDEAQRNKAFSSIYALQLISSAFSIAAYLLLLTAIPQEKRTVCLIQLMYVATGLFDVSWFFFGLEQFRRTTIRSVSARVLVVIGLFTFVKKSGDVIPYTCIMAGCFLLEQIALFVQLGHFVRPVRITFADIRPHIAPNLKLFVPIMALNIYHWVDKLMIGSFCSQSEVAYYEYAESIINLPKGLLQALGTALMPRMAYLVAKHFEQPCRRMLSDALETVCMIACAASFGIIGVASTFIPFFLGEQYIPSVTLVMELGLVMIPMSLSDLIQNQYLVPFKLDNQNMIAVSSGAVVNVILNALLIPTHGASGAVLATLLAELVVFVYLMLCLRQIPRLPLLLSAIPYLLFGGIEALIAMALSRLELPLVLTLLVQIAVAGSAYLLLCFLWFCLRRRRSPAYRNPVSRLFGDMKEAERLQLSSPDQSTPTQENT